MTSLVGLEDSKQLQVLFLDCPETFLKNYKRPELYVSSLRSSIQLPYFRILNGAHLSSGHNQALHMESMITTHYLNMISVTGFSFLDC